MFLLLRQKLLNLTADIFQRNLSPSSVLQICQNNAYHSNLEYASESCWCPTSWFIAWAPIFLMEMDSLIPRVIQASSFITLPQLMVWLVCAVCTLSVDGCTSVNESFFLDLVNLTSSMSSNPSCALSDPKSHPCLSHVDLRTVFAWDLVHHSCGGASWLAQHHGSGTHGSMLQTGPLCREWW